MNRGVAYIVTALGTVSLAIILAISQACMIIRDYGDEYFDNILRQMSIPIILASGCIILGVVMLLVSLISKKDDKQ